MVFIGRLELLTTIIIDIQGASKFSTVFWWDVIWVTGGLSLNSPSPPLGKLPMYSFEYQSLVRICSITEEGGNFLREQFF